MKKPKEIESCPLCSSKIELKLKTIDIPTRYKTYKDCEYWVYCCDSCDNEFTTTESDTISMENFYK